MLTDASLLTTQRRNIRLLLWLIYAVMAQVYTNLWWRSTIDLPDARLDKLAAFTAHRPYQYRVLVPAIVHVFGALTRANPDQIDALFHYMEYIAAFTAFWAFRLYLSSLTDLTSATLLSFALLPAMMMIHIVCSLEHYPYDTPQIAFFAFGLWALRRQRWGIYYATLLLALFNRETSVLLIIAFALTMFDKMPKAALWRHLAMQSALFAAVKALLSRLFAANAGSFTESHVGSNRHLVSMLIHGDPAELATCLIFAGTALLLYSGRKYIPEFATRLCWLAPLYVAIMWEVGNLDEVRAYNEMILVIVAPILLVLNGTLRDVSRASDAQFAPDVTTDMPKAA